MVLTYRSNATEAQAVVGRIEALGRRALALELDVGASCAAFTKTLKTVLQHRWQRERVDYLVNNAGVGLYGRSPRPAGRHRRRDLGAAAGRQPMGQCAAH